MYATRSARIGVVERGRQSQVSPITIRRFRRHNEGYNREISGDDPGNESSDSCRKYEYEYWLCSIKEVVSSKKRSRNKQGGRRAHVSTVGPARIAGADSRYVVDDALPRQKSKY